MELARTLRQGYLGATRRLFTCVDLRRGGTVSCFVLRLTVLSWFTVELVWVVLIQGEAQFDEIAAGDGRQNECDVQPSASWLHGAVNVISCK